MMRHLRLMIRSSQHKLLLLPHYQSLVKRGGNACLRAKTEDKELPCDEQLEPDGFYCSPAKTSY
jgi:hypothetical protein